MIAASNEAKALQMKQYMKGKFDYFGISSPERKSIQKRFFPAWKKQFKGQEIQWTWVLWNQPQREMQYVAMDWMKACSIWKQAGSIRDIEAWLLNKTWWDTLDFLASTCVGGYFLKFPEERDAFIEKWNNSSNFWMNRTAILFQLKYKKQVDVDLLFALIDSHKDQKEFFIRKAIGWALRELSKTQPEVVKDFLKTRTLSGLSVREASKYL
ncbi:MAG: DNA alkylation repair protein [Bacteroidota bacterium]|nr:DNA alkylation repair protein [Bacteroidota bacterium]MDX5431249.1 DNA alkylation repair protein [Bacteroidota bacterium]MDX5469988.1 DNA alkylation repair protein [Bacteroidota bacterium]